MLSQHEKLAFPSYLAYSAKRSFEKGGRCLSFLLIKLVSKGDPTLITHLIETPLHIGVAALLAQTRYK